MKQIFTTLLFVVGTIGSLFSQATPELLYYKFDGTGTSVPNLALTPPAGTNTATLMGGLTQGPTGQCQGAVIGSGNSSSTDYVNTGWATNLSGMSWTISMYTIDITASSTLFYIFGDANAGSFRCFTNGVAGPNNWILRGTGITDVTVGGGATVAPHVTTFVYDMSVNTIYGYLDGVLVTTVVQGGTPVINGAGPFKVIGYGTNVGAPVGGKLDEFRVYNRALTAAEVAELVGPPDVYSSFSVNLCGFYTVPSGDETYSVSGTYMDTIPAIGGCADSIMTITVSINNSAHSFAVTACDAYTVPSGDETYFVSGTYMDTILNVMGCDSFLTIALTVSPTPTVTATAAASTICSGSSVVLTATGATTYSWSSGGTTDTETVTPTTTTTYTVYGTDNGCTNGAVVTITTNALPVVSLGSNGAACGNWVLDAQNAGATYLWNDATTAQTLNATMSGTYSVAVTDTNGCVNSDTIDVTINPLPVVALGADVTQCAGTVTFDAQNAGAAYLWNDGTTTQLFTTSTSGIYYVDVTDANGCVSSDTVVATINALPVVDLGQDFTQCGSAMLDAGNAGSTYDWSTTATSQTISVSSTGPYSVEVTDENGCVNSDTIIVTINALPAVTASSSALTACLDDAAATLTGTPVNGTWSGPGVTGSSFNPMTAGTGVQTVTYSFTDANNCSNTATVSITVSPCVTVEETDLQNSISIYPNPNNGVFTFAVNANIGDMQIVITDLQGRVVYSSNENNISAGYTQQINLQGEANGMYLMQITGNGEQRTEKIFVQQ
jgi:hypothetical protein